MQGLACLGSRKSETASPSVYAGRMKVAQDGSKWKWDTAQEQAQHGQQNEDSMQSNASTVIASATTFSVMSLPKQELTLKERIEILRKNILMTKNEFAT